MAADYDLVIRGGTIVDGTGAAPFAGDVAIQADRIVAVGDIDGVGETEIDAAGKLVTPGFVDIHTHYDGQVIWSHTLSPSSHHGVTTVVMGNCGVGFAPCRPDDRERLIELMEGVEDIPEIVMAEGLTWEWESFPEYLDVIAGRSYDVDIAAQLPHSALRLYVMGSRAVAREPSTAEDNEEMAKLAREAMAAGAIGFGTSRTLQHRTGGGDIIPTYGSSEAELSAIASGMREAGHGVIELAMDLTDVEREFELLRNVAKASDRTISFGLAQLPDDPGSWRVALGEAARSKDKGLSIRAQVTPRGIGMLLGHELTCNPFSFCPGYRALDDLPFDAKIAKLREPETRARILSEPLGEANSPALERVRPRLRRFEAMFPFGDPPNYEPAPETALSRLATASGVTPEELAYDLMLENDGRGMLYLPSANYVDYSLDPVREMLIDDNAVLGLGDGGAHCGSICDASYPTFMLEYWTRDRKRGTLSVPWTIRALTSVPADVVGLHDRGRIALGLKADLNVIDYDRIHLHAPRVAYDFPGGGRRLTQEADGFDATILSGVVTYRHGEATGILPGQLIRGPQAAPGT